MNRDELEEVIASAIAKISGHQSCYPPEHKTFVDAWIEKERRKEELWRKVKQQTIVWALTGALGYLVYLAWDGLKHQILDGKQVEQKASLGTK